tara:strand:- start:120 stop:293 length:174 start_codon:yes stop_codon:yes gene_type:complete
MLALGVLSKAALDLIVTLKAHIFYTFSSDVSNVDRIASEVRQAFASLYKLSHGGFIQ